MMKATAVYKKGDAYYLHSSSQTTAGVWIATAPFLKIEANSTPSTKGEAVIQALAASRDAIPHPTSWAGLVSPLLELAAVKSWATFTKHAKCVDVEVDGERLRLIPNRNLGSKEGFEPSPEKAVELLFPSSPDQMGFALEEAMGLCE
jgi:hypothetical protein